MDELELIWTQTALKQRNYVFDYWNIRNQNTNYSSKLNLKIKERTVLLKKFPEIGKPTDFKNVRGISLGHYSIFYKHQLKQVIIVAFWDNRQNPKKLLNYLKDN